MRIPIWLRREWAIFQCANGVHVHCPHVSDSPYFNLRPTRHQARKTHQQPPSVAAPRTGDTPCRTDPQTSPPTT